MIDWKFLGRLSNKIQVTEAGCWEWTAYRDRDGYGVTSKGRGRTLRTHRALYETLVGPVPIGLQVDHLCRNRACCNPDHLEPVTPAENTRRGGNSLKTHCPDGHPYDYVWRNERGCTTCRREDKQRFRDRQRTAA